MKTKKLLSVLFTVCSSSMLLAQTSGGPDAFGYTWKTDQAAGGPAVMWDDIKGKGTKIMGLADDNSKGPYNLNFPFHFYWTDYNKITVGSNGWIGFTGSPNNIASGTSGFPPIPDALTKNTVCPLLADLTFIDKNSAAVPGASAWYWTNNTDTLIVQYDSVPYWEANSPKQFNGKYSFQAIFSGVDSSVTFQYNIMTAGTFTYAITTEGTRNGIANSTGTIGLQVLNNVFPSPNTAVKFYYPNPVTYQVFDATPAWNQNPDNSGFFISANCTPIKMKTDIANAGNQADSAIGVAGQIFDAAFNPLWSSNTSVVALAQGDDSIKTYPATYIANKAGSYTYRTTTSFSKDINPANDIDDVEMVVVDTTLAAAVLAYTEATTSSGGLAWSGGANSGGGIYIMPPFYPATATSMDFFINSIAANTTSHGFYGILYDDNGPIGRAHV